jgi:DNA topoisomerase I
MVIFNMSNVVIVESFAKVKTINKYLGKDYKAAASFGHIRNLPSKDGSVLPDKDFDMIYQVPEKSKKHIKEIESLLKGASTIYLACDPDREGEAIAWHIVEVLKKHKKLNNIQVKRIVFNEITKSAVLNAIQHPRDIDMNLVNAQQARTALDYLVGFSISPILWRRLPGSRSAGRVQSVALRLVCEREGEIEQFISREYWDIVVDLQKDTKEQISAKLTHVNNKKLEKFDIQNKQAAEQIVQKLQNKDYIIKSLEKKQIRRNPQPPFTTSSMQQEASRKLGFSPKKTMSIAQKLYEGIKINNEQIGIITYMRTDAINMANEALTASRKFISSKYGEHYLPNAPKIYVNKSKNAQEAHEAIRPSDFFRTPDEIKSFLENDEFRLYELIWKRAIASQMESAVLDVVAAVIKTNDDYAELRATGSTISFPGFYVLYREGLDNENEQEDENKLLPPLKEGESLKLIEVKPDQHFTEPPPRYSEASLIKKLEELGIGRPSTYTTTISVIQEREYVRLEKKRFIPEDRGRIVTAFLESFFSKYVEYDFTAQLENKLDDISDGSVEWKSVMREFWQDFSANIESVNKYSTTEIIDSINNKLEFHFFHKNDKGEVDRQCPDCKTGKLSIKSSKFGAFIGCSAYPDCKHIRKLSVSSETNNDDPNYNEDRSLGFDKDELEILLKKGPYGFYVQKGSTDKDLKRTAVPANIEPLNITLQDAISLLELPKDLGIHPESGEHIKANIGKYGPYLQIGKKFVSVKNVSILGITLQDAINIINNNNSGAINKVIGVHPKDGKEITIQTGRYGPYVKHDKLNAPIPKNILIDDITLETAISYLEKQKEKNKNKK